MRLDKLMRLRGAVHPEDRARDTAAALQRCLQCPFTRLCDEALAAEDAASLALFCPNSHYIQHVRAGSLTFK